MVRTNSDHCHKHPDTGPNLYPGLLGTGVGQRMGAGGGLVSRYNRLLGSVLNSTNHLSEVVCRALVAINVA